MTPQGTAQQRRCESCGGACRRPPAGTSWVLVWRIGTGPDCEMVTNSEEPECEALARIPSSPLPRSGQQLFVEHLSGSRTWWLTVAARPLASARRDLLKMTSELVRVVTSLESPRAESAFEMIRRFARAEMQKVRQPDVLLEQCRALGGISSPDADEGLWAIVRTLVEEATQLGQAWKEYDAELSNDFSRLAGEVSAWSQLDKRAAPPPSVSPPPDCHRIAIIAGPPGAGGLQANLRGWRRESPAGGGAL